MDFAVRNETAGILNNGSGLSLICLAQIKGFFVGNRLFNGKSILCSSAGNNGCGSSSRKLSLRIRIIALTVFLFVLIGTQALQAAEEHKHMLGGELGYILQPFGFEDPYSWSLGGKVFYELHGLFESFLVFFGLNGSFYGLYPLDEFFQDSYLVQAGLYTGYDFLVRFDQKFAIAIAPFIGYSHYWREFTWQEDKYQANRPLLAAGVNFDLYIDQHFLLGLRFEFHLLLENEILFTFAQTERMGFRF